MMSRYIKAVIFLVFIVVPAVVGMAIFSHYALQDWDQLQKAYISYEALAATSSDLPALFKANAAQSIHRINLFADGTWFLLSAMIGAIGLHGFLTFR